MHKWSSVACNTPKYFHYVIVTCPSDKIPELYNEHRIIQDFPLFSGTEKLLL